jgi:calcineurin-like phosphoesterase
MHAEATSEKLALAWFLDGKVSAVLGTHTHVQTSDERFLPQGTAYITDVGMAGPQDSVLGVRPEIIIERLVGKLPIRFELADGALQLDAVVLEINNTTGKTEKIRSLRRFVPA